MITLQERVETYERMKQELEFILNRHRPKYRDAVRHLESMWKVERQIAVLKYLNT